MFIFMYALKMLNSVVHAVTMEICIAILSISVEEMVMKRCLFNTFHVLGPMKLETLFCVLILLFSG